MDLESLPPWHSVLATQIVLESPLTTKVVLEEKLDALEDGGPKVAVDEVESKEEGGKPAPYTTSQGTPTKAKAKKGQASKNMAKKKSWAPSNDMAADGFSL